MLNLGQPMSRILTADACDVRNWKQLDCILWSNWSSRRAIMVSRAAPAGRAPSTILSHIGIRLRPGFFRCVIPEFQMWARDYCYS